MPRTNVMARRARASEHASEGIGLDKVPVPTHHAMTEVVRR